MKYWYSIIFALLISFSLIAQDFNTGLVLDEDKETPVLSDFSGKKFNEETSILKVDLMPYAPTPQDPGDLPSCVGWSVGYAALTIMQSKRNKWVNNNFITGNAFSPHFIYNQLVADKNCMYAGASFPSAFKLLKKQGICKKKSFNVDNEECSALPTPASKREAKENKIKDYYQLFMKEASSETKIRKIKQSLVNDFPVVVGMFLTPDFRRIKKGDTYWSPKPTPRNQLYPHAMVVVGYNDVKKSFELMNSWGPNWGNKGFIYVKYKDFVKYCVLAYQLHLPEGGELIAEEEVVKKPRDPFEPFVQKDEDIKHKASKNEKAKSSNQAKQPQQIALFGDFIFRYPTDMIGDEVIFEEAEVEQKDNYYSLVKKDWEIGQLFQLIAKNIKKNRYVYVFSVDANLNAHVHWPKSNLVARNDVGEKQKFGYTESPLVPYNAAEIIIPGGATALQKQVAGDDYLFVLYSYNLLDDIDEIIENVRMSDLPMNKRLESALGSRLIPYEEVVFDQSKIRVEANSTNGTVLGVMIESKGESN
jgi:hypothetical protein